MIDFNATKYRTKATVVSKYKRLVPPLRASTQGTARVSGGDAVASEFDAREGGVGSPPGVAREDGAASRHVDVADVHGSAGRPASVGEFSPGKILDPRDPEVANYIDHIGESWRRGVQATMDVARLCAEANERLTTAQKKSELMPNLPFGEPTFSKFVQIGTDTRLLRPTFNACSRRTTRRCTPSRCSRTRS